MLGCGSLDGYSSVVDVAPLRIHGYCQGTKWGLKVGILGAALIGDGN